MFARFWWTPLCAACLLFVVLGNWRAVPVQIESSSEFQASALHEEDASHLQNASQEQDGSQEQPVEPKSVNQEEDKIEIKQEEFELPPLTDPNLFVDWDEPQFALFLSGRQHGYIEPCGCTGLARQKGGMMRRHQLMKELQARGWRLLPIDAGNQVKRFGVQTTLKLGKTYDILCRTMNYQAIGFGPDDLKQSCTEVLQKMINAQPEGSNPFVSANVVLLDQDFTKRFQVFEIGDVKICVTSVLGDEFIADAASDDIQIQTVDESIADIWPSVLDKECDYHVLMAFTSLENTEKIARTHPKFDILVTCGGAGEPTMVPETIEVGDHKTRIVQVGKKGMYVGILGIFDDAENPIRYQRVPLDRRFVDSEEVMELFIDYQEQMKTLGLDGMQIHPVAHPSGREFVGSEACYDCHDAEWEIWRHGVERDEDKTGPHWRATLDLTDPGERTQIKRHSDPECVSCHVTGWNPQNYFPYETGFLDLEADIDLHGNGCENCHGPGSMHVAAENGEVSATAEELKQYQLELRVTLKEARETLCMECHDLDNSPDFHEPGAFDRYWEQIKHGGSDEDEE